MHAAATARPLRGRVAVRRVVVFIEALARRADLTGEPSETENGERIANFLAGPRRRATGASEVWFNFLRRMQEIPNAPGAGQRKNGMVL